MSTLQEALRLSQQYSWSVVPLRPKEKVAYIKWADLQQRRLTTVEIFQIWTQFPDANLGVILGEVSGAGGLMQLDADDSSAVDFVEPYLFGVKVPTVQTKRGRHYYFLVDKDLRTSSGTLHPKLETRSRGHLAVVPPSLRSDGEPYTWLVTIEDCGGVPAMPAKLKADLLEAQQKAGGSGFVLPENCPPFMFGNRDSSLFHAAYSMLRGGAEPAFVTDALRRIAGSMDQADLPNLDVKIASAMKRALGQGGRNIAADVKDWLTLEARGAFNTQEMYNALGLHSIEDQRAGRTGLSRWCDEGKVVKRNPMRFGWYEAIAQDELEEMDWRGAGTDPLDINWPLGIGNFYATYPKSIAVVAGGPDLGKSQFALEFVKMNLDKKINFYSSESGPQDFHNRVMMQRDTNPADWKDVHVFERNARFAQAMKPDIITVVDYCEIGEAFWLINQQLSDMFAALTTGIALVMIQKNPYTREGVGGHWGLHKPRLYITLGDGVATILKCKTKKPNVPNMTGKICHFYADGSTIYPLDAEWHTPVEEVDFQTKKRSWS